MAIEWDVKLGGQRPTLRDVRENFARLTGQLGVQVGEVRAFQQQLEQGRPIGPEVPVADDARIAVPGEGLWMAVAGKAIVGVGVVDVPGSPDDEETGAWCYVAAGRGPGARLFALLMASAIAKTAGAPVRDEVRLARLGWEFLPDRLFELGPVCHGLGLVEAESVIFEGRRGEP